MRWLGVLLLVVYVAPAWATKYVCAEGVNTGTKDGTSLPTCWDGVRASSVAGSLFANMGSVTAGETVYVCGDFSPAMSRWVINGSGTAGNVIWLDGDKAVCGRSSNSTISRAGLTGTNGRAISATGKSYIGLRNLTITDCDQYCVSWDYTSAVTEDTALYIDKVSFARCTGTTAPGDCVWKRGQNLTITDSSFDYCYEDCVWFRGKNHTGVRNTFTNISYGDALGDATQIDFTGVTDSGAIIWTDNYCDHTKADNKYCVVAGPTAGAGSSVLVSRNTMLCPLVPTNPTPANQCHPVYLDTATATAIEISRNFTQGGEVGISVTAAASAPFSTRALVYGNIVFKASDRGIWTDANVDNIDVWDNDVSEAGNTALYIGKAGASVNANNNLFMNSPVGLFYITAPTSRGFNSYWRNTTNISVNGTGGSLATGDLTADPKLVGGDTPKTKQGFRLLPSSPLKCAGTRTVGRLTDALGRGFEPDCVPIGAMVYGRGDAAPSRAARN